GPPSCRALSISAGPARHLSTTRDAILGGRALHVFAPGDRYGNRRSRGNGSCIETHRQNVTNAVEDDRLVLAEVHRDHRQAWRSSREERQVCGSQYADLRAERGWVGGIRRHDRRRRKIGRVMLDDEWIGGRSAGVRTRPLVEIDDRLAGRGGKGGD